LVFYGLRSRKNGGAAVYKAAEDNIRLVMPCKYPAKTGAEKNFTFSFFFLDSPI
jgi:hypothetical protein